MELSILHHPLKPTIFIHSQPQFPLPRRKSFYQDSKFLICRYSSSSSPLSSSDKSVHVSPPHHEGRRQLLNCLLAAAASLCVSNAADAVSTSRRALRGAKIPESEFTTLPNGLKYYDLKVGTGAEAVKGSRVAVRLSNS